MVSWTEPSRAGHMILYPEATFPDSPGDGLSKPPLSVAGCWPVGFEHLTHSVESDETLLRSLVRAVRQRAEDAVVMMQCRVLQREQS